MGIRYYAYPINNDLVHVARENPRLLLSDDPLMDAWGPQDSRPEMLYLDKCWREFQLLFRDSRGVERAAFALVAGEVTMHYDGWEAHLAVLDADEVAEISRDLATIDELEMREGLSRAGSFFAQEEPERELDYVMHYLRDAQSFTRVLAERGDALVYLIG